MTLNRKQIAAAAVVWFVLPQVVLWPFRSTLAELFPQPTAWQTVGMVLGLIVIFVLGVGYWNLRQRINERDREGDRQKYTVADD
jgi:Na+/melibiose symporter-like transporter